MAIIDKPSDYFNTVLYTGNGGTQSITGLDFQPDWVWLKCRNRVEEHVVFDVIRGATKKLLPNRSNAESTEANTLTSFNSDGFSLGSAGLSNSSGDTFASWNWKAGTSFTNDASATGIGTIDSTGSASDTAGFSIVSYTGTGSAGTIKHGLSTAPSMIIIKDRSANDNWNVYNSSSGNNSHMHLNLTNAATGSSSYWNTTTPTSSVFSLGSSNSVNANGNNFIAYCFADTSMSKMGSYTGNGSSSSGPFIFTGFKPAFLMIKATNAAKSWMLLDNKRNPSGLSGANTVDYRLRADTDEATSDNAGGMDFLSNGFKPLNTDTSTNQSGTNYIYQAFAENPFTTSTGVPATAR